MLVIKNGRTALKTGTETSRLIGEKEKSGRTQSVLKKMARKMSVRREHRCKKQSLVTQLCGFTLSRKYFIDFTIPQLVPDGES